MIGKEGRAFSSVSLGNCLRIARVLPSITSTCASCVPSNASTFVFGETPAAAMVGRDGGELRSVLPGNCLCVRLVTFSSLLPTSSPAHSLALIISLFSCDVRKCIHAALGRRRRSSRNVLALKLPVCASDAVDKGLFFFVVSSSFNYAVDLVTPRIQASLQLEVVCTG